MFKGTITEAHEINLSLFGEEGTQLLDRALDLLLKANRDKDTLYIYDSDTDHGIVEEAIKEDYIGTIPFYGDKSRGTERFCVQFSDNTDGILFGHVDNELSYIASISPLS